MFSTYVWSDHLTSCKRETCSKTEISNLKSRANMIEQSVVAQSAAAVTVGRKIGALSANKAKRARQQNSPLRQ